MTIHRSNIVLQEESEGVFKAVSFGSPSKEWVLNTVGVWIHSLVSKGIDEDQLIEAVSSQFSELDSSQLKIELDEFYASEFLQKSVDKKTAKHSGKSLADGSIELLRVYFTGRKVDDLKNEFLLWVLWNLANVVSVVDSAIEADLIVCESDIPAQPSEDKIYLLWGDEGTEHDVERADLVFSAKACANSHQEKWFRVTPAALDKEVSNKQVIEGMLDLGLRIERMAYRLLDFLTGEQASYYDEQLPLECVDSSLDAKPLLSIGMATFDDYDGVYFSITSLQIHHPEVFNASEIIILDNNPTGNCAKLLKGLAKQNPNIRYEPYTDKNSTAVRDILFKIAKGDWVMCMDCHVMYPSGVLDKLVDYIDANPTSIDILQGPLLSDGGKPFATQFDEKWGAGMYGSWGWDKRADDINGEAFEIPMQGLGMFVARKDAWPGINTKFTGFGGEEGYLHEKFRLAGGRALCLPFLHWAHRFGRPSSVPYVNRWEDRINNYLVGFDEIGYDKQGIDDHFTDLLGEDAYRRAKAESAALNASPVHGIDHAVCINLDHQHGRWAAMSERFTHIGVADKVKRFSAISTPECHHIGCTLSHRRIIESAKKYGYESVLVFEDDALFLEGFSLFMTNSLAELSQVDWNIFYLGGFQGREEFTFKNGQQAIKEVPKYHLTCTHGVLYHHSVFDQILADLPATEAEMAKWVNKHHAIDQYLMTIDKRYVAAPKLVTQPLLLEAEEEPYKHYYK